MSGPTTAALKAKFIKYSDVDCKHCDNHGLIQVSLYLHWCKQCRAYTCEYYNPLIRLGEALCD